jgi:hypothetical protein
MKEASELMKLEIINNSERAHAISDEISEIKPELKMIQRKQIEYYNHILSKGTDTRF